MKIIFLRDRAGGGQAQLIKGEDDREVTGEKREERTLKESKM